MTIKTWEAYALRYANLKRRRIENFITHDLHDGPMEMDYFVWFLRSGEETILIDTGFGAEAAERRKRTLLRWLLVHFKYDGLQSAPDVIGRYLETASSLGITDDGRTPVLTLPRPVETTTHRVAIAPGSRHWNKQWPTEHHVALARTLLARGYELVYYGSTSETTLVEEIRRQLPADARHTSLAGALDLSETARSLAGCAVAVVNDSGLMHVARAVGTPVVALFGPTVRAFGFAPRVAAPEAARAVVLEVEGLSCRPCTAIGGPTCPKGHFRCMQAITPEQVLAAVTSNERTATP